MNDQSLILFGGGVKALGGGKVGGHLVLYGDKDNTDLAGEWFTPKTDFDMDFPGKSAIYYQHGLDPKVKTKVFGRGDLKVSEDELGIWIEGQLNLRDKYAAAVYKMAEDEKLGWSSGTAPHLVEKKKSGEITRWPLGLDASLTPTPCEPRILATVKTASLLALPTFDELTGEVALKSTGPSTEDLRRLIQKALSSKFSGEGVYPWVRYDGVFGDTFVYELGGNYYEAPYTINGLTVTIGDGSEVEQLTQYVPKSPPIKSHGPGRKAAEEAANRAAFDREYFAILARPSVLGPHITTIGNP